MGKMILHKRQQPLKRICFLLWPLFLLGCSASSSSDKGLQQTGALDLTPQTAAFVQAHSGQRQVTSAAQDTPLQLSFRVAPAADVDTVCQSGAEMGPYEITPGTSPAVKTLSSSQPVLRHINSGSIALCLIITSPVDATLNASTNAVTLSTDTCEEAPAAIAGIWSGDYSCSDSCDPAGFSGTVQLTILQDGYGATYTDDEGASYEGTVCGNVFKFSGGGTGFTESGIFVLNADGSGSKTSSWSNTDSSCYGDCSDPNLQRQ